MSGVVFGLVKLGVAEGVWYLSQGKKYCLKCNGYGVGMYFWCGSSVRWSGVWSG